MGGGDSVEEIAGRYILEIARKTADDGLGHYNRKTLGDCKGLKGDSKIHVARDKRVGRQLPGDGRRGGLLCRSIRTVRHRDEGRGAAQESH